MADYFLLGMGNTLRSDDGAGSVLAQRFSEDGWVSVDGGSMPENFAGVIRRESPEVLVIVDACDFNGEPGAVRRIPAGSVELDSGFNAHTVSIGHFINYIHDLVPVIVFVGIQPVTVEFGEIISVPVREAMDRLESIFRERRIDDIPVLEGTEE